MDQPKSLDEIDGRSEESYELLGSFQSSRSQSPVSSAEEALFYELREVLNRKETEILQLRSELEAKESTVPVVDARLTTLTRELREELNHKETEIAQLRSELDFFQAKASEVQRLETRLAVTTRELQEALKDKEGEIAHLMSALEVKTAKAEELGSRLEATMRELEAKNVKMQGIVREKDAVLQALDVAKQNLLIEEEQARTERDRSTELEAMMDETRCQYREQSLTNMRLHNELKIVEKDRASENETKRQMENTIKELNDELTHLRDENALLINELGEAFDAVEAAMADTSHNRQSSVNAHTDDDF